MLMPRSRTSDSAHATAGVRPSAAVEQIDAIDADDQLEHLREEIQEVSSLIAPVWPLRDFVAVNPWLGLSDRRFSAARRLLRSVSDAEMLMPMEYYRSLFASGRFTADDVREAVSERNEDDHSSDITVESLLSQLQGGQVEERAAAGSSRRTIRTIAEITDATTGSAWGDFVSEELGTFCGGYFDEGQAAWSFPWKHLSLFQAWRSSAQVDRRGPLMGLSLYGPIVRSLPHTPEAAIAWALTTLRIPADLWGPFLLCQAFSVPGWCAWAKYQDAEKTARGEEADTLIGLLAVRLVWDVILSRSLAVQVDWSSLQKIWQTAGQRARVADQADATRRLLLLRATELAWQRSLIGSLPQSSADERAESVEGSDHLAQMVFCIDVRSERYRRHLEQSSDQISTYGFAGFFGVPVARQPLDSDECIPQVPALLRPKVIVADTLPEVSERENAQTLDRLRWRRQLKSWWKQLQSSAVSCFGFVETAGLLYGSHLLTSTLKRGQLSAEAAMPATSPDPQALEKSEWSQSDQVDLAESILRGIGITSDYAPLVVLCGHGSSVANNPLKAGLDCGACCGHSGEFNARFAAGLLNRGEIRRSLIQRGIHIPQETWFTAAVHNTTTDKLTFPDAADVPAEAQEPLQQLRQATAEATMRTQTERLPDLGATTVDQLMARATDWSEVRPEWGLAGNAAFIVGPRSWTRGIDLGGRTFLHSYDEQKDADFAVLEQIMTAPLVVAHWISMQYYASSVDNRSYGSGSKTIHNVVGRIGVLSGNGGDLMTGLPLQSVSDGETLQHQPLRLLAVVKAPRTAVEEILQRHSSVEDLVINQWMNLLVCDHDGFFRYTPRRTWQAVPESHLIQGDLQEPLTPSVVGDLLSEPQMQGV